MAIRASVSSVRAKGRSSHRENWSWRVILLNILLASFALPSVLIANSFDITIDTMPLAGESGFLAFDLIDGNGSADNTVTVSQFRTDARPGAASVSGDVAGALDLGMLTMNDTRFFNELQQELTFGEFISFRLNMTTNEPLASSPDTLSFFFLNPDQLPFSTDDPTGADALLVVDITGPTLAPTVYISESATVTPVLP